MGRTPIRKAAPQSRSLSSRLSSALPSGTSTPSRPSPLQFDFAPPTTDTDTQSTMPAQKRFFDDPVGPATPASAAAKDGSGKKPRRTRRGGVAHKRARAAEASKQDGDEDVEDGQQVDGDFDDLFMVDTTPAAVREQDRFVPTPSAAADSPLKKGKDGEQEEDMLTAPVAQSEGKALSADEDGDRTMDSDDAMRAFAREVAETDDDGLSDESDESDEDEDDAPTPVVPAPLYDNEEDLQKAIEGRIVDDSSAPVTGRYYKEADLTKTCVLCGEHGHSSRDCTHSQCFVCGKIDADHEARDCPVALVCMACGSRGHFARDCTVNPGGGGRGFGASRCSLCPSNSHMTINCPSHWRVYDTSGPKPPKRKIVLAFLPRGHPMKHAEPSAFNRAALGASFSGAPYPSSSSASASASPYGAAAPSGRRSGGATGKLDRRPTGASAQRYAGVEDDDDDWFASRSRASGGGGRSGGGSGGGRGGASRGGGGGGGYGAGGRGTHTHFGGAASDRDDGRSRHDGRGGGGGRGDYHDRDGYSMYRPSGSEGRRSGGDGGGRRDGGRNGSGSGGRASLLDRFGGGGDSGGGPGGGRSGGRKPRYQGGYV
ncbi:hypothetical protein JCM8208_002917 [Rhodotorula glutinis]